LRNLLKEANDPYFTLQYRGAQANALRVNGNVNKQCNLPKTEREVIE